MSALVNPSRDRPLLWHPLITPDRKAPLHRNLRVPLEFSSGGADTKPRVPFEKPGMAADRPKMPDDDHRVVPFRPRPNTRQAPRGWRRLLGGTQRPAPPVQGLAKYEGGRGEDDYRHRMMVNLAALVFTVVLSIVGIWLTLQIADMRKTQDCFLSGRRNCTPIDVKSIER